MWPHGTPNFKPEILYQNNFVPLKLVAFKIDQVKTYLSDIDKNTPEHLWQFYKTEWKIKI